MLLRDSLRDAYLSDDLGNLKGTAWGVLNAVSDLTMHKPIKDGTKSDTLTNKMLSIAEFGEPILDKAFTILSK